MHVKLESQQHGRGKLWIDGKLIDYVVGLDVSMRYDQANVVKLELLADSLEIEMEGAIIEKKTEGEQDGKEQ